MRNRVLVLVILFVFGRSWSLPAKDAKWFEVSSEHFLLFTDTNEMKGRRLVSDLETRIATFSEAFGKVPPRQFPIEIFLFNEEMDFIEALPRVQPTQPPPNVPSPVGLPHAPNNVQFTKSAYMLHGPDRIFIVAKDKSPDDIANDVGHALGHALFERYIVWRPFWLAEGAGEYVRKIGRGPDTKPITEQDRFTASEILTIVPSAMYNDNDPPTPFRTESYRLLRLMIDENPDALKPYLQALRMPSEKPPTPPIDGEAIDAKLQAYTETPLKSSAASPTSLMSSEAAAGKLAIHRGDLLLATDRQSEASRYYNGDTKEARAARAIVIKFSRPGPEAVRVLDRASKELPDNGLVQYHFGTMEIQDKKDIESQVAALERGVQLLPLMGRAFAELARVYTLNGQAEKGLPLITKALELEPEYADRFFEVRADVDLGLGKPSDALRDINTASDLPHVDRSAVERYAVKVMGIRKRIEAARREVDQRDLDSIRQELRAEAERREPPPQPSPPPPPVPGGNVSYEIQTRAAIEVLDAVFPDYPESLRKSGTTGTIALQVDVGPDGKVKTATIASSQLQTLNKDTVEAVKKWTFKPGNRSIRLVLKFSL